MQYKKIQFNFTGYKMASYKVKNNYSSYRLNSKPKMTVKQDNGKNIAITACYVSVFLCSCYAVKLLAILLAVIIGS